MTISTLILAANSLVEMAPTTAPPRRSTNSPTSRSDIILCSLRTILAQMKAGNLRRCRTPIISYQAFWDAYYHCPSHPLVEAEEDNEDVSMENCLDSTPMPSTEFPRVTQWLVNTIVSLRLKYLVYSCSLRLLIWGFPRINWHASPKFSIQYHDWRHRRLLRNFRECY